MTEDPVRAVSSRNYLASLARRCLRMQAHVRLQGGYEHERLSDWLFAVRTNHSDSEPTLELLLDYIFDTL